jgi:hypothetical protein
MAVAIARLGNSALRWVVFAGGSWGLTMATGFLAINVPQCGLPCPADVLTMTAICVGTGMLTVGPFAAIAARR